jgi:hypothetical protein
MKRKSIFILITVMLVMINLMQVLLNKDNKISLAHFVKIANAQPEEPKKWQPRCIEYDASCLECISYPGTPSDFSYWSNCDCWYIETICYEDPQGTTNCTPGSGQMNIIEETCEPIDDWPC